MVRGRAIVFRGLETEIFLCGGCAHPDFRVLSLGNILPSVAKATAMEMVMDGLKAVPFHLFFIASGGPQGHDLSVEKHVQDWSAELQIPRLRSG
jgi:hypothetical protein